MKKRPTIIGILNVTSDSFSDPGLYLNPSQAIQKGNALSSQGADLIDIGAESSNPDGQKVSSQEEIDRLLPVIKELKGKNIKISIDTYKPEVMEAVLKEGVDMINDITALRNPESVSLLKRHKVPVVIMHAKNRDPRAKKQPQDATQIMNEILKFFHERLESLEKNGISKDRLIIDPGMGFFLGANPEPSLKVLHDFQKLKTLGLRTYLSTSLKSFIGSVLKKDVSKRAAGTLTTEIWGALQGVDYIRTHDVQALHDAIMMLQSIQNS